MSNLVVYAWHLFQPVLPPQTTMPSPQEQLQYLQQSGFNTVIPWTIHVMPNGDLVYNEVAPGANVLVTGGRFQTNNFPELGPYLAQLKSGASSVSRVLFCIGSAVGAVNDFADIKALLSTAVGRAALAANFTALVEALPAIDGFDFDNESQPTSDYISTMAQFAEMLSLLRGTITFCPYEDEPSWVSTVQDIYTAKKSQPVAWWNLQCYAGGADNTAAHWVDNFPTTGTGVSDAAAYILPGVEASTPAQTEQALANAVAHDPGVPGAFLWEASAVWQANQSLAEYATAMRAALATANK